jgi:hypothetical protein
MTQNIAQASTGDILAAIASLTDAGKAFMTQVGQHGFDFFDDGIVEGSGNYGRNMAEQMKDVKSVKSASGIMNRTTKLGLWTTSETESDAGMWWSLTALGAEVAQLLALGTDAPAVEVPAAVDDDPALTQEECEALDTADVEDEPQHASVEDIESAIAAGEAAAEAGTKPLGRKPAIEALRAAGYTGPVSYLVPKLNAILANVLAGGMA